MLRQRRKGLIQRRLKPQRLGYPGLQIVADRAAGNPAKIPEGPVMPLNPVHQLLTEARHREGQRRGSQNRDKYLRPADLAGLRVDHIHRLAGIVGLHHRPSDMTMAEARTGSAPEDTVPFTEPAKAITFRVG